LPSAPSLLLSSASSVAFLAILKRIVSRRRKHLNKLNAIELRCKRRQDKEAKESTTLETSDKAVVKFAGNASALSSIDHPTWLKTRASTDWNPDTGASSHMTPHQHWFRSYSPPIRLADNSIVYSGLESVEFQPNGLNPVFHVPALGSNLLSVFQKVTRLGLKMIMSSSLSSSLLQLMAIMWDT
jgi:hypothetical protein